MSDHRQQQELQEQAELMEFLYETEQRIAADRQEQMKEIQEQIERYYQ